MRPRFWFVAVGFLLNVGLAAAQEAHLSAPRIETHNKTVLQRGARLFHNYCLTCHSAHFVRYQRMGEDLGIPAEKLKENLMFTTSKPGDTMQVAMRAENAKAWFGKPPPDLSLTARYRGQAWLYNYLKGFYEDDKRPFGVNNVVFPDVAMPHVLVNLEGLKRRVTADGKEHFEKVSTGLLDEAGYDRAVRDIVAYMSYLAEPAGMKRPLIGVFVLIFLGALLVLAILLKREVWKDVQH
jgi:ubiquinol-cytochrome c reductase cytochrome c1 subunit